MSMMFSGFNYIIDFTDTIGDKRSDFCSYDPRFYIEIADQRGCISRSNIATTRLEDDMPPDIPIIKDVSVDINGNSVISWTLLQMRNYMQYIFLIKLDLG